MQFYKQKEFFRVMIYKMKTILKKYKYLFALAVIFISNKSFAAGLVPCEGVDTCNFDTFVKLLNNVAGFLIFKLPLLLLIFLFAWTGIQLIINRDKPNALKTIKDNLLKLFLGYILVLGAYVIVKTFITILAGQDLTFKVFFN